MTPIRSTRSEAFLRQACDCIAHDGNFCLASLIHAWFGADVTPPVFAPFHQPTLAVGGLSDRSHRKSDKRSLLALAPYARFVQHDSVGHFPEIEDPMWFDSLLRKFLADG